MAENTISLKDNRTDKSYDIEISYDTIHAPALRQIKVEETDFGMMSYDPGFKNTASTKSKITFIDGAKGILSHRGYRIEDLAENSSFLEVAYLVMNGELPSKSEFAAFEKAVIEAMPLPKHVSSIIDQFPEDAHPMGVLVSALGALSAAYPDAKDIGSEENRQKQFIRLIAHTPTIAAYAYRNAQNLAFVEPRKDLSFVGNFVNMMFNDGPDYRVNATVEKALDTLFLLHADHEQNCSTTAMRCVGSAGTDPFAAAAAATAALYGPLHGGANEAVLKMLAEIGSADKVEETVEKAKNGQFRLMGFGHRVYKNYDPRAKVIKNLAHEVFEVVGKNPLIDIATALEKEALEDEYFVKRKLFPNVDFYSGLIYQALELPTEMFTVLFAIGRMSGWGSQWNELCGDSEQKIARPRQVYIGAEERPYVPMSER